MGKFAGSAFICSYCALLLGLVFVCAVLLDCIYSFGCVWVMGRDDCGGGEIKGYKGMGDCLIKPLIKDLV